MSDNLDDIPFGEADNHISGRPDEPFLDETDEAIFLAWDHFEFILDQYLSDRAISSEKKRINVANAMNRLFYEAEKHGTGPRIIFLGLPK